MKLHRAIAAAMPVLRRTLARALAGAMACACVMAVPAAVQAQELASEATATATVETPLDMAIGLRANGPVGRVVVSQPETAQVASVGDDQLYLIGSQPGTTNLLVYDRQGRLSQSVDVTVGPDAQALRDLLAEALPGEAITVKGLSSSLLLEGEVSSPSVAAIAETLAERIAPDAVISRLHARSSQVLLEVRIVEVSSRRLKDIDTAISIINGPELGVSIGQATPGGLDTPFGVARVDAHAGRLRLDATLRALEDKGQLRVVAQPSLVALSGETASFRAGGEFPFPLPSDGKVTIEFRPYGAAMKFKPVVQENGLIRIALEAELSDIDPSVALRFDNITVPGLKVRRAATTTGLRDGEAFMIAGLFEESSERSTREPPFLTRLPLIGPVLAPVVQVLRKKEMRRELAIVVTPRIGGQAVSPLGERSLLLAQAEPEPPLTELARTPKSVSAPRGPPLRALMAEVRDALRPPARWIRHAAARFSSALRGRA